MKKGRLLPIITCGIIILMLLTGCLAKANQKPTLEKVDGLTGTIDVSSSTFEWSGSDPDGEISKYEFRKDGGNWEDNGLSTTYEWSGYTEGEHTFEVRAKDDEGNYSNIIKWTFIYNKVDEPEYLIEDYVGETGGTLYLSASGGPSTFNDAWAQETSSTDIIDVFLDSLIGADNKGEPSDTGLAKKWWLSEDKKTVYYEIRQGLQWSDGEPFTVEDIVWTFEEIYFVEGMTANGPTGYYDSSNELPEIEVIGNDIIAFTWSEPSFWGFRAVSWTNILPKHVLEEAVDSGNFKNAWGIEDIDELVGMGPFIPVEYKEGEELIMERNPNYYRIDKNDIRLPYLDEIEWKMNINSYNAFIDGEIDIYNPTTSTFGYIEDQADEKGWKVGQGGPVTGSSFIALNFVNEDENKREWFRNVHFRRALTYLLDKEGIVDTLYNGLGTPLYGPVPPSSGFYNPEIEDEFPYDYSVIRARLELKQGGFDWDDDGNLIDDDGNLVEFNLITNTGNNVRETISNILVESAGKVGIEINFTPVTFNTLVQKLTKPDYDAVTIGLSGGADPGSGYNVWRLDGGLHFFNYSPELRPDTVPQEIYKVFDWEQRIHDIYVESTGAFGKERKELFDEFQMICAEYQPLIFTVASNYLYAHQGNVHLANPEPNPFAGMLWKIHCIWKEE
jgi:peptide/nickel transport system substrate-binding protein